MRVCLLPVQRQLHRPARIDRHERKTPRGAWLGGVIVQSETGLLQLLAGQSLRQHKLSMFLTYASRIHPPAKTHLGGYCICSNESPADRSKNSFQPFAIEQIKQLERRTAGMLIARFPFTNGRQAGIQNCGKDGLAKLQMIS